MIGTNDLEHIVKCTSQYDSTCRQLAEELLRAYALYDVTSRYAALAGDAWRMGEGTEIMDALQAFAEGGPA